MALLEINPQEQISFTEILKKHPDMLTEAVYEFVIHKIEREENLIFKELEIDGTEYITPLSRLIERPHRKGGAYSFYSKDGCTIDYEIKQLGRIMPMQLVTTKIAS